MSNTLARAAFVAVCSACARRLGLAYRLGEPSPLPRVAHIGKDADIDIAAVRKGFRKLHMLRRVLGIHIDMGDTPHNRLRIAASLQDDAIDASDG